MSGFEASAELLPGSIRQRAYALPENVRREAQEFRLRLGRVPTVTVSGGEIPIKGTDPVSPEDLARLVEIAGRASPYAAASAVRCGYLTTAGGVRVGLCGRMRPGAEESWTCHGLTSAAVRIPREVRGCAERFCRGHFVSTLILSPPGAGKTTLLRDIVRLVSDGGLRVALCDERGEVAGSGSGGFAYDVGEHTDVLSERAKHEAALQLLRTMNPEVLAMDEITDPRDAEACRLALGCGVRLLATAHGDETSVGNACRELLREGAFRRCIRIRRTPSGREYTEEAL